MPPPRSAKPPLRPLAPDETPPAAGRPQGVAGELLEAVQGTLGELPVLPGALRAELAPSRFVEHGPTPQRKTAAAAAGSRRDLPCLVQAYAQAATRGDQRRRAAGD